MTKQQNCVAAMRAAFDHAAERRGERPDSWVPYLRLREPQILETEPEWAECLLREALGMAASWVAGGVSWPENRPASDLVDFAAHEADGEIYAAHWATWAAVRNSEIHWQEHMLCRWSIARWGDAPPIWERGPH